jgi:hypothetical protein
MKVEDAEGHTVGPGLDAPPPPPAPDLLNAVAAMKPVRTRTRFGAFLAVLAVGVVAPAASLLMRPMRRDLAALPVGWIVVAALLWASSFLVSLAAALVPRREEVLPAAARASRVALAAMAALFLFALFASVEAPGVSLRPEQEYGWSMMQSCAHCLKFVLPVAAVFLVAGVAVLRRVLPVGARRIGVALGAAGGAVAGLALHFQCPIAGTAHVVLAHVGGMVLAAIAGGVILPAWLRR